MKIPKFNVGQIRQLAACHPYLKLYTEDGSFFTVNSRAVFLGSNKTKPDSKETLYTIVSPVDFHTYISFKIPFQPQLS